MSDPAVKPPRRAARLLGEFAIIFAGVTLGLLADDWRQNRDDRDAERVALEDLAQDLVRDSLQLEQARAVARQWDRAALWVRRTDPGDVSAEEASEALRGALSVTFYRPLTASYSSLKHGGELDLIRDPALRRRIVEYFEEMQPSMAAMDALGQDFFFEFQGGLWPYFTTSVSDSATSLFPSEGTEARPGWRGFWADDRAQEGLDQLGRAGSIWAFLIPSVLRANAELRGEIAAELE